MSFVFNNNIHEFGFEEKKKILLENKIALWDVYSSANRTGSMDNKFIDIIYNDFNSFFKEYSNIKVVMVTGNEAYNSFEKLKINNMFPYLKIYKIPSTSGANRRINMTQKSDIIKEIFKNNYVY